MVSSLYVAYLELFYNLSVRLLDHLKVHALISHLLLLALHSQAPKISSYVFKMFLFFSLVVFCLTLMPFFPFGRFLKIMVTSDVCSPVTPVYPRIFPRISDSTCFLAIPTLPKVYSVVENVFVQCRSPCVPISLSQFDHSPCFLLPPKRS